MGIDIFLAAYLLGVIVVLCVLSVIAYKKQVERGEIDDAAVSQKGQGGRQ